MDDSCNTGSQPKPLSFRNIPHLMTNSFHRLRNRLQHFIEAIFAAISSANFFLAIFATLFGTYEQVAMLIAFMIFVDWVRSIFHYDYMGYFSWLITLPAKYYTKCKEQAREYVYIPIANAFKRKRNRIERALKAKLRESAVYFRGFCELCRRLFLLTSDYTPGGKYTVTAFLAVVAIIFFLKILTVIRVLVQILAQALLFTVKANGFFVWRLLWTLFVKATYVLLDNLVFVFLPFMAKISYYFGAVFVDVSSTAYMWLYPWFCRVCNYRVKYLTPSGIGSGVFIFWALLLAVWFRDLFSGTFYSEIDGKQYAIRSSTASNTDHYRRDSQRGRDSTSGNTTRYDCSRRRTTNGESSLRNRVKTTRTEEREPASDNSDEGQQNFNNL